MKKLLITLIFSIQLIASGSLYSMDLGFAREDGGRPGAFLQYGAGARSLAMGKTFVGIADDASATYWNPAGLGRLKQAEITILHASLYEKTGYSFASTAYPTIYGSFGAAIVNLNSTGFQLRDEFNYEIGEAGVNETAALLSYGIRLPYLIAGGRLSTGASIKIVSQNVAAKSATGYGLDAGLLWKGNGNSLPVLKPLSLGVDIQNLIAPRLTLVDATDKYPSAITLGLAYRFLNNNLLTAVDLNKTENRSVKVHIGGEYILLKMLALRAGLDETELTAGMGFTWENYSLDYAFAYHDAWAGHEDLGASHRFGLTVKFGNR
jgi:hypothetical protein